MKFDSESLKEKAKELVAQMTLEEKAGLCSGQDCWSLKPIKRLGLESVMMMDGPHGLRKQIGVTDNLGVGESVPAVCFPTASSLACSFDRTLVYEVGRAIGEECAKENVSAILGPGVNQKRSPLCGRSFEYFSEDPVLSGELAVSLIQGIQSTGTGTSLKHFAVNNQEKRRMTVSAVVDDRTLRETYLKAFEIAVKKGKPMTVMCSYNRLNGEYCSENKYLLTDILRDEWGFDGIVVSDWGAVNDRVLGVKAGMDLEMPGNDGYNDAKIVAAVKNKSLSEHDLDKAACRVTAFILKCMLNRKEGCRYDKYTHHQLAVKAAQQSAVLLKNDEHILPGSLKQKAAVIGAFAKNPRYQGAGSSKINPIIIDNPWDAFEKLGLDAEYAQGYSLKASGRGKNDEQETLIKQACETARNKDIVYIFAGLPEGYESEGFDRKDLSLPQEQNRLIDAVSQCNDNVVVILIGGAPMALPWLDKVKGVLLAYLGGEGVGTAITNLLLGVESPSGKLAETWSLDLNDTPAHHYFPGGWQTVEHRESIYIGYRYYDKAQKKMLFPFGHGLSYSRFEYADIKLDRKACSCGEKINLTFSITNTGSMPAMDTALIFTSHKSDTVFLPEKELRDFVKVHLELGETKQVTVSLDTREFGYYNPEIKNWYTESGDYKIMVSSSSQNHRLQASVTVSSPPQPQTDLRKIAPSYYDLPKGELVIPDQEFEALYGKKLPVHNCRPSRPYSMNNTPEDIQHTFVGKIIIMYAKIMAKKVTQVEKEQEGMMLATILEMPFFAMVGSGEMPESMAHGIIDMLNGHFFRGLKKLFK